jgi:hypothetical protein
MEELSMNPMLQIVRDERMAAAIHTGTGMVADRTGTVYLRLEAEHCETSVQLRLILLRDTEGSILFLPPLQDIVDHALLAPAVPVTKTELTAMREAALYLANRHNHVGSMIFRFLLNTENSEFTMIEAASELSLDILLSTYAMRYALAGISMQLELGIPLAKAINTHTGLSAALLPRLDYFTVCSGTRNSYASNLPAAVFAALGENALTMETENRNMDKSLKYALELLQETKYKLTVPDERAAQIKNACRYGFSKEMIETLTGRKMKLVKTGFICADAGFANAVTYYSSYGCRNETPPPAKPRLLLINDSVENDALLISKTIAAQDMGSEVSLLSPDITAAPVDRHYAALVSAETKTAVQRAENPTWTEELH